MAKTTLPIPTQREIIPLRTETHLSVASVNAPREELTLKGLIICHELRPGNIVGMPGAPGGVISWLSRETACTTSAVSPSGRTTVTGPAGGAAVDLN